MISIHHVLSDFKDVGQAKSELQKEKPVFCSFVKFGQCPNQIGIVCELQLSIPKDSKAKARAGVRYRLFTN
jgi:hypothetical protein